MVERNQHLYVCCRRTEVLYGKVSKLAKLHGRPDGTISVETFGPIKPDLLLRYVPLSLLIVN